MKPLKILHLEDDPADAELVHATLLIEGIECETKVVATREDFEHALENGDFDVILADFALPNFDGMTALSIVRSVHPYLPFIFISGRLGEEAAIESLKNGATDYVLKSRLSRLAPAVTRALGEAEVRAERIRAEKELARAYEEIRERAEKYHNLFTSIRDVIIMADLDRTIVNINSPAVEETFGYTPEEVIGLNVRKLYADDDGFDLSGKEMFNGGDSSGGKLMELNFRRKNGEVFIGEINAMKETDDQGRITGNIGIVRDISKRKLAEAALREAERRHYQLQAEILYAAEIQARLLPRVDPALPGFDIAGRCIPAKHVGGDFFDWQTVAPGVLGLTLGDVMGKGIAAAMLMATVRAAIRSVALHRRPAKALQLAQDALLTDLENSESFVTLFHGHLRSADRSLSFVDCGHGYVFVRRSGGTVRGLSPRGLPVGVRGEKIFREGKLTLEIGDVLVLYSDGLIDARPDLALDNRTLGEHLESHSTASQLVERLLGLIHPEAGALPDDVTVMVVRCTG
jgi:PAS domain S-box-containing protein